MTINLKPGRLNALRRSAAAFALICVAAIPNACGGDLTSPASFENVTRVFNVYAISGTSIDLPAAYQFTTETLVRPQVTSTGGLNFDVAFDIGADGRVLIIPARRVVPLPPLGAPVVALQKLPQGYGAAVRAPTSGYTIDSAAVAGVGDAFAVQLLTSGCFLNEPYYGKLVIDSIIPADRRIVIRSIVNRNCGLRSLTEGLPKN